MAPYPALPASAEGASEAWPEEAHIEVNTDLLYVNHSCDPNVAFEVPPGGTDGWEVRALKDLAEGEVSFDRKSSMPVSCYSAHGSVADTSSLSLQIMTFAYWTTEWDMDQPFDCLCDTARCVGRVTGAKDMKESVLATYPLNKHIVLQKKAQLGLGADQALGGDRAE